jgi:hypothetical protein
MSTTLSYGYVKPQTGDRGSVFFPALEANIQQLNDHDHDGTDSAKLTTASSNVMTESILAASWGATIGNGQYRQLITLPVTLSYDTIQIFFRNSSGETVFTKHTKASSSTYYVYTNDDALALTAVYTS